MDARVVFLIVAILAGGKLANASRAMLKVDSDRPTSWILAVIKYAGKKAMASLKFLATLSAHAYRYLAKHAAVLLGRYQKARAARLEQRKKEASEQ